MTVYWRLSILAALSLLLSLDGNGLASPPWELPAWELPGRVHQQRSLSAPVRAPQDLQLQARQLRAAALNLIKKATHAHLAGALADLKESAREFEAAHDNVEAAADFISMGEIYATWSKYDRALQMYQRALDLSKDSNSELQC